MELYYAAIQLNAVAMYILHWTPQHTMVTVAFMAGQSSGFIYSVDVYLLYIPPDSVGYHGNKYLIGKLQPCTEKANYCPCDL